MVRVALANCQRRNAVPLAWLRQVTTRAAERLRIRHEGVLAISFIDDRTMGTLHGRFLGDSDPTDVLTFRYAEPLLVRGRVPKRARVLGEVLVSPAAARRYARRHGVPYREELARYVIHGLLHWLGHEDRTLRQQRQMRTMEDAALRTCA